MHVIGASKGIEGGKRQRFEEIIAIFSKAMKAINSQIQEAQ